MKQITPDDATTFGTRLMLAMNARGITQEMLAQKVNASQPTVSRLIKGKTVKCRKAADIAKALSVPLEWLVGGVGDVRKIFGAADAANLAPAQTPQPAARIYEFPDITRCEMATLMLGLTVGEMATLLVGLTVLAERYDGRADESPSPVGRDQWAAKAAEVRALRAKLLA